MNSKRSSALSTKLAPFGALVMVLGSQVGCGGGGSPSSGSTQTAPKSPAQSAGSKATGAPVAGGTGPAQAGPARTSTTVAPTNTPASAPTPTSPAPADGTSAPAPSAISSGDAPGARYDAGCSPGDRPYTSCSCSHAGPASARPGDYRVRSPGSSRRRRSRESSARAGGRSERAGRRSAGPCRRSEARRAGRAGRPGTTHHRHIVPLYSAPGSGTWATVAAAKRAHPSVPILAIVNPNSGPGTAALSDYLAGIRSSRAPA